MKILICMLTVLFTYFVPAYAEDNIIFEPIYELEEFHVHFSEMPLSLYSESNVYDEIADKIYKDLLIHNIQMLPVNNDIIPAIYCDLRKYNLSAETPEELDEIKNNIKTKIDYDVINSHGEIFYIDKNIITAINNSGNELYGFAFPLNLNLIEKDDSASVMNNRLSNLINIFNKKCNEIIAQNTEPGMSDEDIILALHDALMKKVEYDDDNYNNNTVPTIDHRAYSAIVGDVSVCQGYTLAYMHLLDRMGIETKFIPSTELNHAWNAVKLDNEWYHIDLTWDDEADKNGSHIFFLLSDKKMQERGHKSWEHVVDCNSNKYENGYIFNTSGFTTTYKKGYFWYMKDGVFYKSTINSNPIIIEQSDFLPYNKTDISISPAYIYADNKFSFADINSDNINITFKNNTSDIKYIIPYMVVYNDDNTIEKIIPESEKSIPTGTTTISTNINDIVKSNQYIKIFFREKDKLFYPSSNYIEIN